MMQESFENLATKKLAQSSSSNNLGGYGCLVLFAAIVGAIVFSFSKISTQRDWYFSVFSQPTVPQGSYATVAVKEFRVGREFFDQDVYVITLMGTGHPADSTDKYVTGLSAGSGLVYTLECAPHFWNRCSPLSPDSTYYARWLSPDHTELAISVVAKGKDGKFWVSAEAMQFYKLQRWEKRDTIQVPTPSALIATYENDDLSVRYPQNWRVEEHKADKNWSATIAPLEGHLGTWVTHGFFVGHVASISSPFPSTLEGAFQQSETSFQKTGLNFIESSKIGKPVGEHQGLMISYTQSSPLSVGERGYLVVVRDDGDGYYYFLMFCPNDEQTYLYAPIFDGVLGTVKFGRKK